MKTGAFVVLAFCAGSVACSTTPSTTDASVSDATSDGLAADVTMDVADTTDSSVDCSGDIPYDATATSDAGCYLPGSPCTNPLACCSSSCSAKALDDGCQVSVCAP